LSRIEWDESISQLHSIRESLVLMEADETLELTDSRLLNSTAQNATHNNKRQNMKRKNKKQETHNDENTKAGPDRSAFDDESISLIEHNKSPLAAVEQSQLTGTKLKIIELNSAEAEKQIETCRLTDTHCSELQVSDDKVVNIKRNSGNFQENVRHRQSLNDIKLSAEFSIKNCSIVLDTASVTDPPTASSSTINPNMVSYNLYNLHI